VTAGWRWSLGLLLLALLAAAAGCRPPVEKNASPGAGGKDGPRNRFVNVTESSGLGAFEHTDGSSGRKFFVEQMGGGCAIFDYDGDGWLDVYFTNGSALPGYQGPPPSSRLYRNQGDFTFVDVTEAAGLKSSAYDIGAAVGDFNNDGWPDLYVCAFGANRLYQNTGQGSFTDVTAAAGVGEARLSSSAAWGDYNGDGYLDLYVANYVKYSLAEDLWCSGFEAHKSYCGPNLYSPAVDTLYLNDGHGAFTDVSVSAGIRPTAQNGLAVIWTDFDGDNDQDIFVADDQSPNLLWRNNGDGTFTDVAMERGVAFGEQGDAQAGMGVDAGDFDGDGQMDLLVTNFSEENNALYRNEGGYFRDLAFVNGLGSPTLPYLAFGVGWLDYDRDGWLDALFANGHVMDDIAMYSDAVAWAQPLQLFHNNGGRGFSDVSRPSGVSAEVHVSRGAAFGDLDNDGRTDVIVTVLRGKPVVLRNESAPEAHWLQVRLRAASGNPGAIGAKVWVTAGGRTQYQEARRNRSYASSSDPRLLFGLGRERTVTEVKVRWPSGVETTTKRPPPDRLVTIEERPK